MRYSSETGQNLYVLAGHENSYWHWLSFYSSSNNNKLHSGYLNSNMVINIIDHFFVSEGPYFWLQYYSRMRQLTHADILTFLLESLWSKVNPQNQLKLRTTNLHLLDLTIGPLFRLQNKLNILLNSKHQLLQMKILGSIYISLLATKTWGFNSSTKSLFLKTLFYKTCL